MRILLLMILVVLLGGCQSSMYEGGKGELILSPRVALKFEYYYSQRDPTAFAVSRDGKTSAFLYCGDYVHCDESRTIEYALYNCRQRAERRSKQKNEPVSPCRLLALGQEILWKGKIYHHDHWLLPKGPNQRSVVVRWHGMSKIGTPIGVYAIATIQDGIEVVRFKFPKWTSLGKCIGSVRYASKSSGIWAVNCSEAGFVTDEFSVDAQNENYIRDVGKDHDGREVDIILLRNQFDRLKFFSHAPR